MSCESPSSRRNFAVIETPLRPGSAVAVRLTVLKQTEPLQIALTTKDPRRVYWYESLPELCETTFSQMMDSETPNASDELAVRISTNGEVYLSHNNRGWVEKMKVDPDLEHHVIFAMDHVAVLSLIGIATGLGEVDQESIVAPDSTPMEH